MANVPERLQATAGRQYSIEIRHILFFALLLRVALMSGFVLGDDPPYAILTRMILDGHYPALCDVCLVAFRPVLLFITALSLKLFGWSEFNFVLPTLACSLISVGLIYAIGKHLFDRTTGLLAAGFLAVFPLDVVNATTYTNDIVLNAFIALSLYLFLRAFEKNARHSRILFALSGILLGISMGVKSNAFGVAVLFILIAAYKDWGRWSFVRGMAVFLGSWLAVQALFALIYFATTGDFMAQFHADLNFSLRFNPARYVNTPDALRYLMSYYPKFMLGLAKEGYYGYQFYPYGFFYPILLLALAYFMLRRETAIIVPLIWFSFLFLMMQFAGVRIYPYYEPAARVTRHLTIATMPALLIIAFFARRLFCAGIVARVFASLLVCGLLVTSTHQAYLKSYFYRDCMNDARRAYELVRNLPYTQIITDYEMKSALSFYAHYQGDDSIKSFEFDQPQYLADSLVILGGARRPDIDPRYLFQFNNSIPPRENWTKLYEVRGNREPWRLSDLVIYRIGRHN